MKVISGSVTIGRLAKVEKYGKNHVTQLIRGVLDKYFFADFFVVFPQFYRSGLVFTLYVTNLMSFDVFNL